MVKFPLPNGYPGTQSSEVVYEPAQSNMDWGWPWYILCSEASMCQQLHFKDIEVRSVSFYSLPPCPSLSLAPEINILLTQGRQR